MESEDLTAVAYAASAAFAASAASGANSPNVSNGFPFEKSQTVTLNQEKEDQGQEEEDNESDEELETPNGSEGSDDAIKLLHQEIQDLRRDRSELQRRMEEMLSEMERSEVGTKSLASHASYLEGELVRTQEDLAAASSAAEEAESEVNRLKAALKDLENEIESIKNGFEDKIVDLELEKGKKEGEIRVLREELRVSDLKEEEFKEKSKEWEARVDDVLGKSREAMEEEAKIRVSREEELGNVIEVMKEKNSELQRDLVNLKSTREEELEKTVKELKEKNSKLEAKIEELSTVEKSRDMGMLTAASGSRVSWTMAAAAAASTGTVAAAVTAFYLRHGRQR